MQELKRQISTGRKSRARAELLVSAIQTILSAYATRLVDSAKGNKASALEGMLRDLPSFLHKHAMPALRGTPEVATVVNTAATRDVIDEFQSHFAAVETFTSVTLLAGSMQWRNNERESFRARVSRLQYVSDLTIDAHLVPRQPEVRSIGELLAAVATPWLTSVNLASCSLPGEALVFVEMLLRKAPHLSQLDIPLPLLCGLPSGVDVLAKRTMLRCLQLVAPTSAHTVSFTADSVLSTLPPILTQLHLVNVSVSVAEFAGVLSQLCHLSSLKELSLGNVVIDGESDAAPSTTVHSTAVHNSIKVLKTLRCLRLCSRQLHQGVGAGVAGAVILALPQALTALHLDGSQLWEVPELGTMLARFSVLQELSMRRCGLSRCPVEPWPPLVQLTALRKLDVSANELTPKQKIKLSTAMQHSDELTTFEL